MTNRYRLRKHYEKWLDIPGYEELYQVSNIGRVRSLDRLCNGPYNTKQVKKGKLLKLKINFGYEQIELYDNNGISIIYKVHRLVIGTFKPKDIFTFKPNENHKYIQIDHINNNKIDNRLKNLQYLSASDNVKKTFEEGRISPFVEYNKINPPWNKGLKGAQIAWNKGLKIAKSNKN